MSEQRNSVAVRPGATNIVRNPLLISQLREKRDAHNKIVTDEMKKDPPDFSVVNPNQDMATLYHETIVMAEALLSQNSALTEALKHRIIVSLAESKVPEWKPTHRHYKGTLYRVTGVRFNADHEELEEQVEYDDEKGRKYTIARRKWESTLESGKQRYEFIKLAKEERS